MVDESEGRNARPDDPAKHISVKVIPAFYFLKGHAVAAFKAFTMPVFATNPWLVFFFFFLAWPKKKQTCLTADRKPKVARTARPRRPSLASPSVTAYVFTFYLLA